VINTGIYDNPFKPRFKQRFCIQLPPRVKQVHVLKKFYKRFTGKFFGFMLVVGIPVADFHGITIEPLV